MDQIDVVKAWCRSGDVRRVADLATDDYVTHGPGGSETWFAANDLEIAQQLGGHIGTG